MTRNLSRVVRTLVVAVGGLLIANSVEAQTVTLDFNTLPSAQGWTYESDGALETSIFSVSGGILTQNTLAGPFTFERYRLPGVVDPLFPFTIEVRARVLQDSGIPPNSFGFCFMAGAGANFFGVGLSTNMIEDAVGNRVLFDNTMFHDYRLAATPGVGYALFVDGNLVAIGPPRTEHPDGLILGDSTRGRGALAEVTRFVFTQVLEVEVEIKPGSDPNSINPRNRGVVPVAVLTTATFDARMIDPSTVRFGATGVEAGPAHFAVEDVDGDGDDDMIFHFDTPQTGIACGDTSATLTGKLLSGRSIQGSDSITTTGCR